MQKSFSFSGRASNPAKKKASPAQLAARKKFAEMARSGAFKKAKRNPAKKGLYANIDAKRKRIAAGSGEKMRKPGSAGAPTNANFKAAAKTAKSNPMEGALLHLYGNKYGQVKQYGNGLYTATILQKVNTGIGEEMDYYDSKEFKTKAGAARWLANSVKKTTGTNPTKRSSRSAVVPNPAAKKPAKLSYVCIAPIEYSGSKYGIDERTPVTLKFSTREMKLAYKCYKLPAVIVQSKKFQEFANDNTVIYMSIAELKTMLRKFIK